MSYPTMGIVECIEDGMTISKEQFSELIEYTKNFVGGMKKYCASVQDSKEFDKPGGPQIVQNTSKVADLLSGGATMAEGAVGLASMVSDEKKKTPEFRNYEDMVRKGFAKCIQTAGGIFHENVKIASALMELPKEITKGSDQMNNNMSNLDGKTWPELSSDLRKVSQEAQKQMSLWGKVCHVEKKLGSFLFQNKILVFKAVRLIVAISLAVGTYCINK
eukprot:TRINITY_DN17150_c0_g1_i1.p1 TRINITY_DN17150_c0_g1~~TRINITY_DN17150_c0_g1_i1.p1  ORF type:complete len:218 (-),score=30.28 TRINITY_DN17150_c0_g1_i1:111-764(-)